MKIAVFGDFTTFCAAHLGSCLAAGLHVTAFVVTKRSYDKRRRRERALSLLAPRLSVSAQLRKAGIPVIVTEIPVAGTELATRLAPFGGDALVSVGFPGRIPKPVCALYQRGAINVHPALLPNYRGPHPVHAMVRDGALAENAGITIHLITDGFDEGPILTQAHLEGAAHVDLRSLDVALTRLGAQLLAATLANLDEHVLHARPQPLGQYPPGRIWTHDLTVKPGIDDVELDTLIRLGTLGFYPRIQHDGQSIPIIGRLRRIGPPTGDPVRVEVLFVEFDTRQNRMRARRARRFRRRWRDWQCTLRHAVSGVT